MKAASKQRQENPGRRIVAESMCVINRIVLRSCGHGSVFILMVTLICCASVMTFNRCPK